MSAPERGDVWKVDLDPTKGREQQGYRPVLVISPVEFNRLTRTAIVVPITTGGRFARVHGFTIPLSGASTRTDGVILCHQPRTVDLEARGARWVEALPDEIVVDALARLASLLE